MTELRRKDAWTLLEVASQAGLTAPEAVTALEYGARILAQGFTGWDVNNMIMSQYRQWAEDERAVETGSATVSQYRRWKERTYRD